MARDGSGGQHAGRGGERGPRTPRTGGQRGAVAAPRSQSCIYYPARRDPCSVLTGDPSPHTLPFLSLPNRTTPTRHHRSSHQAFPGGKAAAFLGKSPQDAVDARSCLEKTLLPPHFQKKNWFFEEAELGSTTPADTYLGF